MRRVVATFCVVLAALWTVTARNVPSRAEESPDCATCHSCEKPTRDEPCLLDCPRHTAVTVHHSVAESPEVVILAELSSRHVPVAFGHRRHASMSEFGGGCEVCHHHRSEGRITACKTCHTRSPEAADLAKPSLKGAYHRQCLGCHREWNHATKCGLCHAPMSRDDGSAVEPDKTDIVGIDHPPVKEPTRIVYETDPDVGKYVTFYHDDHIEHFRLTCEDCHRDESCGRCHGAATHAAAATAMSKAKMGRDFDEAHGACLSCHEDHGCEKCHQESERAPFSHEASSGWALGMHHGDVPCKDCHGEGMRMQKVTRLCDGCHTDWEPSSFDHGVAGLALDAVHIEMDCEVCHENRDFSVEPACGNCHDDREHPKDRPGTMVRPQKSR